MSCLIKSVNVDGTGKVNRKGVAYYNRLIDYLLKRGKFR
jgi:beta-glucosidase/6-phospho-beta-glucosidase/beta-galactosidase